MNAIHSQDPARALEGGSYFLQFVERLKESFVLTDHRLDPPGPTILHANAAFCRMTGYDRQEVVGRTPSFLQGEGSDREVLTRLKRDLRESGRFEGQVVNYRKDGSAFLLHWYVEALRDGNGKVRHYFAVQKDLTARHEQERLRLLLQLATDRSEDQVMVLDSRGRVLFLNPAAESWMRLAPEAVLGRPFWKLPGLPKKSWDLVDARECLARGEAWKAEYEVRRTSPLDPIARRFLRVHVIPLEHPVELPGQGAGGSRDREYLVVARDITEQRRLRSIAEATNVHDSLGMVFAGLRHELSNPINSFKAALDLTLQKLEVWPRETIQGYLEGMRHELERVEYLLSTLRGYNMYQTPRLEAIEVESFIQRFRKLVGPDLEGAGIELSVSRAPELERMTADPQALVQILLNLVSNAAAALEDRPAPRIEISFRLSGSFCQILVADNGAGIEPSVLDHVFEPFYTTREEGTGLGLAITERLVSAQGGTIEIVSAGRGTTVALTFDQHPRVSARMAQRSSRRPGRKPKIWVAPSLTEPSETDLRSDH